MRFALRRYRLPLTAPLVLKGVRHDAREGVLVRLEDDAGRVGWGDAAMPRAGNRAMSPTSDARHANQRPRYVSVLTWA